MNTKKHKIPIYGGELWVCVTNSFLKSIEEIEDSIDIVLDRKKEDLRKTGAITYSFYLPDGSFKILVMVKSRNDFGYIAHEALHVVNTIFLHAGIKYSMTNDEPQCYLIGWVCDKIMKK